MHLRDKSREVSIEARWPPASLLFIGHAGHWADNCKRVYLHGNNVIKKHFSCLLIFLNVKGECPLCMMTSRKHISQPNLNLKMQIANFIVDKFPEKQIWKEYPRGSEGAWGLSHFPGSEFWACDVIMNKTYWSTWQKRGQRKNLRPRQESNPWPPEHWAATLSNELREHMENKVI